jgi:DNA-binding NtrC family response regulator
MNATRPTPGTRVLESPTGTPSLVVRRARLQIVGGPDAGREVELEGSSLSVGTDPGCDLVVGDPAVSARHFSLAPTEHGILLTDLGSTNGTFVDGYRAGRITLNDGSTISAGESRFEVVAGDGEVTLPMSKATNFGGLLGHSPAMRALFAVLEAAAKTDATVLILGESGTGKELAARALHERSARRDAPYVVFDAGAASATLVESQLFGHARGAFTGATDAHEGVFEAAEGGTLVLDEIGELPLALQPKLLRALEARTVTRLGETAERPVNVRIVACTNRNLDEEVRAGRFRADLFFRMSVVTVRIPPLRERKEEIPRLVRHFVAKLAGDAAPDVPASVLRMLEGHDWPGNVRELRNFVERMLALPGVAPSVALGAASPATPGAAPGLSPDLALGFHEAKRRATDEFEHAYLRRLVEVHGDNLSEAARVAGLSRQSCYRLLYKHGLRSE